MNIDQPELVLGKQADTDAVNSFVKELTMAEHVHIKRGETDAYLSNYKLGISLLFESERYAHVTYGIYLPSEAPVLVAIFMYGEGDDEFSPFKGGLIKELLLTDGRHKALEKLGKSDRYSEKFNSETWNFQNGIGLILRYSKDKNGIRTAQYGVDLSEQR